MLSIVGKVIQYSCRIDFGSIQFLLFFPDVFCVDRREWWINTKPPHSRGACRFSLVDWIIDCNALRNWRSNASFSILFFVVSFIILGNQVCWFGFFSPSSPSFLRVDVLFAPAPSNLFIKESSLVIIIYVIIENFYQRRYVALDRYLRSVGS